MAVFRLSLVLRWSLIASVLLLIGMVIRELLTTPTLVTVAGTQGLVYILLFVGALLIFSWFALFGVKAYTPAGQEALRAGVCWGLCCAAAWVIELLMANVVNLSWGGWGLFLYYSSALAGYLLPGLAGGWAAWHARRLVSGLQASLLTGMMGALAIFLASLFLSPWLFNAGQHDPQTLQEFARSGLPDLRTFVVSDYLAGMIAHLWIGLTSGLFLGLLGGTVGKTFAHALPGRERFESLEGEKKAGGAPGE